MEVTESDLQILALAEEVERLQSALSDERAARDHLRRRFLKLSSPAAMAVASANQKRSTNQDHGLVNKREVIASNGKAHGSAMQHVVPPIRASVVDRVQLLAQQPPDQLRGQRPPQPVKQPGPRFSLWAFITGADRVTDVEDN